MNESKKTILLVEDDPMTAFLERNILEKYQYSVINAFSAVEAIEATNEISSIDLILMDIDLGKGIDGTEAASVILENHDIPLIFLSGHTERAIVELTEGISSYGYIVKNTGETVLIASIKMAFRLFEARKKEKEKINELERFHKLTVDREITMITLKKEINELLIQAGKERKYVIVE